MSKGKTSNILVWILMAMLVVGLGGFGATNFGGSTRSVGKVGDTEIDIDRYARELQQELRALSAQAGRTISLAEAQQFGITQNVLARIVNLTALEDEAHAAGISVGDENVRKQILEIPAFQGVNGTFDREAYAFTLERTGLSVAEFEARVRIETAGSLVQNAIVSGTTVPAAFTDTIYDYARETRDVTWARLSADDLEAAVPAPTDAELEAYHEANPERFTTPETRVITYAWLTPDMIVDSIEPDEASLRALYDTHIGDYVQPERRLVERLVFSDAAAAEAARARLDAGEVTFDDLVAERGLTLNDVDLGDLSEADLGAAGAAVFALTEPGIAGPSESSLGPALFRMNGILAARNTPFEEVRDDLVAEAAMDAASRQIDDQITELDDMLAGGATLEELASETDMELGQIEWRDEVSDGIAAYEGFRTAAAEAQDGDFPEIVRLDEGGIFALRLDEIRAPALQPLDTVREEATTLWTAEKTDALLAEQAEAVAETLRGGREMAAIRLPLGADRGVGRDSFIEGTPGSFVTQIFEMERGEFRVIPDAGAAYVVRLDAINPADHATPEAAILKGAFGEQVAQDIATDTLNAYTQALQVEKGIEINQSAISAVHAQFP